MKRTLPISMLLIAVALSVAAASLSSCTTEKTVAPSAERTEKISAAGFIAIRTAAQKLESYGVPVDGYAISVVTSDTSVMVAFTDPKGCAPFTVGNCGDMAGFTAYLTPDGKQVIEAAFTR
jgi:hypothetical protein